MERMLGFRGMWKECKKLEVVREMIMMIMYVFL